MPPTINWGIVGEFNNWGVSGPDIVMSETSPNSNIFTAQFPYSGAFKFRLNSNWVNNYGSPTWPSGQILQDGPNIDALSLEPSDYYNVTMDLHP